jgi:hypothetical protein
VVLSVQLFAERGPCEGWLIALTGDSCVPSQCGRFTSSTVPPADFTTGAPPPPSGNQQIFGSCQLRGKVDECASDAPCVVALLSFCPISLLPQRPTLGVSSAPLDNWAPTLFPRYRPNPTIKWLLLVTAVVFAPTQQTHSVLHAANRACTLRPKECRPQCAVSCTCTTDASKRMQAHPTKTCGHPTA